MRSYVVADVAGPIGEDFLRRVERLAGLGADFIQLRDKESDAATRLRHARLVRSRVKAPTRFLVNSDRVAAMAADADGLHLTSAADASTMTFPESWIVGQSCHGLAEVERAAAAGLDYVLLGPAFPTRSKESAPAITLRELADAAARGIDVYALGGVSVDNLQALSGLGLTGVAAVTLFMRDEPLETIMEAIRRL
jgi:thiamine-phosphate diphosphorylase